MKSVSPASDGLERLPQADPTATSSHRFLGIAAVLFVLAAISAVAVMLPWAFGTTDRIDDHWFRGFELPATSHDQARITFFGELHSDDITDLVIGPAWDVLLAAIMAGAAVMCLAQSCRRVAAAVGVSVVFASLLSAAWALQFMPDWADDMGVGPTLWLLAALGAIPVSIRLLIRAFHAKPLHGRALTAVAIAAPAAALIALLAAIVYTGSTYTDEAAVWRETGVVVFIFGSAFAMTCGLVTLKARPRRLRFVAPGVVSVAWSGLVSLVACVAAAFEMSS